MLSHTRYDIVTAARPYVKQIFIFFEKFLEKISPVCFFCFERPYPAPALVFERLAWYNLQYRHVWYII